MVLHRFPGRTQGPASDAKSKGQLRSKQDDVLGRTGRESRTLEPRPLVVDVVLDVWRRKPVGADSERLRALTCAGGGQTGREYAGVDAQRRIARDDLQRAAVMVRWIEVVARPRGSRGRCFAGQEQQPG